MKLSILFVDDDNDILLGYKNMLFTMRKKWDLYLATSVSKALEILNTNHIDILISDLKMPGLDGNDLLNIVKDKWPNIIRIALSAQQDYSQIVYTTQNAHQFLSKPCDATTLKSKIQRTYLLQDYMRDQRLKGIISGIDNLPTLPKIYFDLERALNTEKSSMREIADIISHDITITAKILQIVNSAFFGLPNTISNISQAVQYLGINIIKSLVIYIKVFSLVDESPEQKGFYNSIWEHSYKVANAAKAIAIADGFDKNEIEEAFLSGLLHDIGKIVMTKLDAYPQKVLDHAKSNNITFSDAELDIFETSHAEAGAYLLGIWGLPDRIVENVAFHHFPSLISEMRFDTLTAVHLANSIVGNIDFDHDYINILHIQNDIPKYRKVIQEYGNQ